MSKKIEIKNLTHGDFNIGEIFTDAVGNFFITRGGVARVLSCALPTLRAYHKRNGLLPLARRINGKQVYLMQDVVDYYNKREK